MGFNKSKGISSVIAIIALLILNLAAFSFEMVRTSTFWIGYSFATLAVFLVLFTALSLFNAKNEYKAFFRLSPVIFVWAYFIPQMAVALVQMFVPMFPYLLALIINILLTVGFIAVLLSVRVVSEAAEERDLEVAVKVLFIQNVQTTLNTIKTENTDLSESIRKLSEDFRYSDPMSHSMLKDIEQQIESKVLSLKANITKTDYAFKEIESITDLLKERNMKCKMLKGLKDDNRPNPAKNNGGVAYVSVTVAVIGLVAAVVLTVCHIIIPLAKYAEAKELYVEEDYSTAAEEFEELGNFRDSEVYFEKCLKKMAED